ncbi:MAG TPA: dienelactone hydrolase family protein [Candidatus Acidoferrum sp.]|nr:dienelactone hydrolase family protein [Candidatus Acidoferrum sp.]
MKRFSLALAAFLFCLAPAFAQDWAQQILTKSPRHREWVKITYGSRTVNAVVIYPEVKDKAPAVVVIHEIFGLSDWVQTVGDQLAANGYIAIVPDLLSGMGPGGGGTSAFAPADVNRAVSSLPPDQVTADLNAVADYVKKLPAANGKLAVAGFCWGGGQSFRFATNRSDLSADFVFYGTPPPDVTKINTPVYGFYAGNDARVDATIPAATDAMKAAGKKYEPVTYDGAGHGFMRAGMTPGDPNPANATAHDQAWVRWVALLKSSF